MYYTTKTFEISGARKLFLDHDSNEGQLHGYTWNVEVTCGATELNENGRIVEFEDIKSEISGMLDHKYLNDIFRESNPTAENVAKWICDQIDTICETGNCIRVMIQEGQGNQVVYENDEGLKKLAEVDQKKKSQSQYITS